jgi:sugar O-acyltransferase (sialic acid O-acetyltransferase NeuD family)
MKKEQIILVGGGGHCTSCIDVIEQENRFSIEGIIDVPSKIGTANLGYRTIGNDEDLPEIIKQFRYFLITVGHISSPDTRIRLFNQVLQKGGGFPVIISPYAYVSKHSTIGDGTIIMHHAIVNAGARIGKNCIINSKALVEHDAEIGDHCHISTGAVINGNVKVGKNTFFGSGATSKQSVEIPPNSFIKANSIVK